MCCDSKGFTLLEMLLVLVILGLLTSVGAVSLLGVHRQVSEEQLTARLLDYESMSRAMSRRFGRPGRLVFDGSHVGFRWIDDQPDAPPPLALPRGYSLRGPYKHDTVQAEASIYISRAGRSDDYALCLIDRHGAEHWLMVAGLGGQVTEMDDGTQVRDILAILEAPVPFASTGPRPDAD